MDNIFTIKERILQVVEYKHLVKEFFFRKMNITYGNFKGKNKNTPLNSTTIANIFTEIPDLNLEWLITGDGTMLKPSGGIHDGGKTSDHFVGYDKMVSEIAHLKAELSAKNSQIADLRDHISTLKTQLSECQNDKKLLLSSVFSDKKTVK